MEFRKNEEVLSSQEMIHVEKKNSKEKECAPCVGYEKKLVNGLVAPNVRVPSSIVTTRYPSSAIAPSLPHLFDHDAFRKGSTFSPLSRSPGYPLEGIKHTKVGNRELALENGSAKVNGSFRLPPELKGHVLRSAERVCHDEGDGPKSGNVDGGLGTQAFGGDTEGHTSVPMTLRSFLPSGGVGGASHVARLECLTSELPESQGDLVKVYHKLQNFSLGLSGDVGNEASHHGFSSRLLTAQRREGEEQPRGQVPHSPLGWGAQGVSTAAEGSGDSPMPLREVTVEVPPHPTALREAAACTPSTGDPYRCPTRLGESRALSPQKVKNLTPRSVDAPPFGVLTHQFPSRLLLVMRRFSHQIIPVFRPNSLCVQHAFLSRSSCLSVDGSNLNLTSGIDLNGAVADYPSKRQYHLTMQDAQFVSWTIQRNQFGIDLAESFEKPLRRIVVTDPGVTFSLLSQDADVQRSLRRSLRDFLLENDIIPVFLDSSGAAGSERYSEEVLSPLFHYITPPVSTGYHNLDWTGYRELNIFFLNAIVEHYRQGDWILVINYQLMLLPKMLRERPITRNAHIGFYLSTLFPSSEMYRMLPQREELLRGVLAASFIGFHSFQYKRHFFTACTRVLGVECSWDCIEPDSVVGNGAGARVVTIPRGINPHPWLAELQKPVNHAKISELRERLKGIKVLLGVDTLDYTKGIPNKILAFNKFLVNHPEWASNVVFYQICVPKRQKGWSQASAAGHRTARRFRSQGRDILSTVYHLVGSINANFGNLLHQPIHFLLSPLSVENLVCLYGLADIVVITPLRESLSWTAYEFVLCQSYTNKGVLILSEFSGSAQSLGAAAICVNPWDADALAVAIHDALVMKDEEKLERHQYGVEYVLNYDCQAWGRNLLEEFCEAVKVVEAGKRTIPRPFPYAELIPPVISSVTHRILILGLRGTLYPSSYRGMDPQFAGRIRLSRMMDAALNVLSQDPHTHILVISSSPVSVLEETLGHLTNITLVAENGHLQRLSKRLHHLTRSQGKASCTPKSHGKLSFSALHSSDCPQFEYTTSDLDLSWMEPVLESCFYFEQRTPGSFLVRTATSIGWNYHGAQREHGTRQARDLLIHLWARPATVAARTDIVLGPHSVEIRSAATSKAAAIERWISMVLTTCVKKDVSNCMVLCASNFLPCDEAVFCSILKELNPISPLNTPREAFSASPPLSVENPFPQDPGSTGKRLPRVSGDSSQESFKNLAWMCTVGVKPSHADYSLKDDREVERLLTLLAALVVIQPDGIGLKIFQTNKQPAPHFVEDDFSSQSARHFHPDVLSELKRLLSKPKRRLLLTQLNTSTLCSNPDIQRALVLAAHYYYSCISLNFKTTLQGYAPTTNLPHPVDPLPCCGSEVPQESPPPNATLQSPPQTSNALPPRDFPLHDSPFPDTLKADPSLHSLRDDKDTPAGHHPEGDITCSNSSVV